MPVPSLFKYLPNADPQHPEQHVNQNVPGARGYAGRMGESFLFSFTFFSSLFKAKRKTQDFNDRRGLGRVSDEPSKVRPSVAEHIFGNQTTLERTLAPLPSLSLPSSAIAIINE